MKKGRQPLNPEQHKERKAVASPGGFLDPAAIKADQPPAKNNHPLPSGYVPVTQLWTSSQKKEVAEHAEDIEAGFKNYSAY